MNFSPLTPEDYPRLKPFFAGGGRRLSAYCLPSLIAWSRCFEETSFAVEDDALFVREVHLQDPGHKHLLLPVRPRGAPEPSVLREKVEAAGLREYHFVPEDYLQAHGRGKVEECSTVQEQPEYEDYVYRTSDLASLTGRDYAKKRNLVRQFEREFAERGTVRVGEMSRGRLGDCLECLEGWRRENPEKEGATLLECERKAITQTLAYFDALEFRGIRVEVEGRTRGFAIAARLSDDTGALCFEKASDKVKGLYQFLDREAARRLFTDLPWINKESDLGDPGLAKAKQSYHPALRLKSYKLTAR